MQKYFKNISDAFDTNFVSEDHGGLVDELILASGFALVAIAVVTWIGGAIMNRGADVAQCIEGANVYASNSASENCSKANHNAKKDWKDDQAYKKRFG